MQVVCFWPTHFPRAAWLLTMQNGVSVALQSCGNQQTSSIGSQLAAMTTSFASLFSTKWVTWFKPNLIKYGWAVLVCFFSFLSLAAWRSLAFLSAFSSGGYLARSLKRFLAKVMERTTLVGVTCLSELVEGWWNFQSLHKDSLLSLQKNVSRPSNKSGQISFWLNTSSNSDLSWSVLKETISFSLSSGGGSCFLLWCDFLRLPLGEPYHLDSLLTYL